VRDRGADALRCTLVRRAQPRAVRKRDLGRGHTAERRLLEVARAATHERRDFLGAANSPALLVAHGPGAIPGNTVRAELRLLDALAEHRLHGVAPQLADPSDIHLASLPCDYTPQRRARFGAGGIMEIRTRHETVTTPDGVMPVYVAEPTAAGRRAAVLVIMEAFGLNAHIEDVTRRIASEGYVALAPDLYWRDLPDNKVGYDELPKAIGLMRKVNDAKVVQDLGGALDALAKRPNVDAAKIGVTGFCMGGRLAFLLAAELPERIAAAAPFYGGGIAGLLPKAEKIRAPLYLFFGEKDAFIPLDQVEAIDAKLKQLGKSYTLKTYTGAVHGFCCNERPEYDAVAAADAWKELLGFFRKQLGA
jgi:carboxymethylenebutenolidase